MRIEILGSGGSGGIPRWSCNCEVCEIARKRGIPYARRRFTIMLSDDEGGNYLIDTGPDLRVQLMEADVRRVNGVFWTHFHYDHSSGFGDFYKAQEKIHVYGLRETVDWIMDKRELSFVKGVIRHYVKPYQEIRVGQLSFQPFIVAHKWAGTPIGWIIYERKGKKKVVITGDTGINIPEKSLNAINGLDLLIANAGGGVSAYRAQDHFMNIKDAQELNKKTRSKQMILVHFSHKSGSHDKLEEKISHLSNVRIGYDYMEITL